MDLRSYELDGIFGEGQCDAPRGIVGDFYREADDVCRGVTLTSPLDFGSDLPTSYKTGDPYPCSADDVMRGGVLMSVPEVFQDPPGYDGRPRMSGWPPHRNLEKAPPVITDTSARFSRGSGAPPLPSDDLFELLPTTVFVQKVSAERVGNALLDFFSQEIEASITEVNISKFKVRASACVPFGSCGLKVRVYRDRGADGTLVVEFQRLQGSPVAHVDVFKQAVEYIRGALPGVVKSRRNDLRSPQRLNAPAGSGEPAKHFQPIFDMALAQDSPDLQTEAAAAMLEAAQHEGPSDDELTSSKGLQAMHGLLKASCISACGPAARLLLVLAGGPRAERLLEYDDLMQTVVEKATERNLVAQVRLCMAEVAHKLVVRSLGSAWQLGSGIRLRAALDAALRDLPETVIIEDSALSKLQSALLRLDLLRPQTIAQPSSQ